MTSKRTLPILLRVGSARALTRALDEGKINEPGTTEFYFV